MPHFRLLEATAAVPPGITSRYFRVDPTQTDRHTLLVVSFEGDYPDGSRGNAHGSYVATTTLHGVHLFRPECLLLDLRGLSYRWGNSLLGVFQDVARYMDEPGEPPFPVVVVTSERSREGLLSLVGARGEEPEWHFTDLDAAIRYGIRRAQEWLDS